jgi:hypothetical protein
MEISRETFKTSDQPTQNLILFESIKDLDETICKRHAQHDKAHKVLDEGMAKAKKINSRTTAASGLLGGFLAVIVSKLTGL